MLPTLVRRFGKAAGDAAGKKVTPLTFATNTFRTRKVWPPDFKELSPQQQLRFEKKYKRRIVLATRAPFWNKCVRIAQLVTMTAAMVWLLFYSEFEWWGQKYKASDEIRKHARTLFGALNPDTRFDRRDDVLEAAIGKKLERPEPK
ncbi:hypothetical protein B0I35DRAFT_478412 [Stachybotrys elegans]|uniref:Uncharacterized protein n=1 Tax=Stachybotrys elegans TaxID=80388 RepID=A0A8K0SY83_9HYPO|nr:hypothetical protein B0I35DRAFT_478412 [Stachybotrys elegans]